MQSLDVNCDKLNRALECLADYEDTGLTPAEITEKLADYDHTIKVAKGQAKQNQRLRKIVEKLKERTMWVPVSERMPEEQLVLVNMGNHDYTIAEYHDKSGWWEDSHGYITGVTHWMSLPEPPEEDLNG